MRSRTANDLLLGFVFALSLSIAVAPARSDGNDRNRTSTRRNSDRHNHNLKAPLSIVGVIPIPGSPMKSSDLIFADPGTARVYLADRSNASVDIFDAENNVFVGRVTGMAGVLTSGGGTSTTNDRGPNGVLVTPSKLLWAGDGNSTAQMADVDPTHTSTYLKIIQSISTANPECDGGTATTHYCGRADELAYDPADHIIMIANDEPLTTAVGHAATTPYASFISTDTYAVLGQVLFPGATGLEQPVWDAKLHGFLITVPGAPSTLAVVTIQGKPFKTTLAHSYPLGPSTCTSANGAVLGPFQHVLVSACGFPEIVDALSGKIIATISQVAGGDEVWYNAGDGRFYVASTNQTTKVAALGVIDAETSTWLQNVDAAGAAEPTAFAENNHVFTDVKTNANPTATPPVADTTVCATYGYPGNGCVVIYTRGDDH